MKTLTYIFIFLVFNILFFIQCKHNEKPTKIAIEKFNHDSILANDSTKFTSIKFDKERYDFGKCIEGDKITKKIEFTNIGKFPLVITQAYGSCGCTVPKYNKEPVASGKKGQIEIEFNSSHKVGANTKSVMIEANTNPPITTISFSIKVNESKKKKGWFN